MLAAALVGGFAAETASLFDEFWLGMLTVIAPLVLLLTAALAASLGEKVTLPTAVVQGVVAGSPMGMMFVLGAFSPFALELGERDLNEFGGDLVWYGLLALLLLLYGLGGAALGAVCGAVA